MSLRRLADRVVAAVALLCVAPILAAAAVLVRLVSPGPVFYRARRVGEGGRPFTMYKLRTMRWAPSNGGPPITATDDPRVFPAGAWLRRAKIDELPQLVNVLLGDMAIVGPRPEDPAIVRRHYTPLHHETLRVPPGLTSPGSLYQCTHGDALLAVRGTDPERAYVERVFPLKLAIDLVYVRRASWHYDLMVVARTIGVLAAVMLGRRRLADPPELAAARRLTAKPVTPRPLLAGGRVVAVFLAVLVLAACRPDETTEPPDGIGPPGPVAQLVGAGDIASCAYDRDAETAALLDTIPGVVFTTGDNAYPNGTPEEYVDCYGPTWGRHRARTRPTPGNHEYYTAGAAGYFGYFGAAAGPSGRGYYSYDLGAWHIIALNSSVDVGAGSAQIAWLRSDLAGRQCTLAYWHHPRFSSGSTHGSHTALQPVWDALFDAGVEIVINGHEHNYERFAPQTPAGTLDTVTGIRQFVVGTGGSSTSGFVTPLPNSEVRQSGTPGVLALSLQPNGYTWRFVAVPGSTFTDTGSGTCHGEPASAPAGARPARE